ncbi:serine/threonine-protein kinase PLK4 isoform X2 [Teleopsis dalmanni]|uniref:serine/threonine-protein kinase PLK4 isoform X2 n=1 Tax=Teleopsis dalmanni TaxID=139649 RepID=UPI0018CD7C6C|nr:serine/threonine-protein kinase PLK4 isoform X2 [Teleopsis dalmanni]
MKNIKSMSLHSAFGEKIEDYEVLNLLGKGGFASVYKARCLKTNQMVAIKMIDKKLIQGAGMASRVRQEVEIQSRLKHPSVLELFTFFQDNNYVYLVLELAHNGELHRFLKHNLNRTMKESEAAIVLQQVVSGLLYLHSNQIMHRDISLSNLLLSKDMHIKIADFGLATQLKRPDEKHITMCGTPNYISPEVISRSSHGLPADVWGLGCLLYTLLVGKPPFDSDAVQSTLNKVIASDFYIPGHISHEAQDLIRKLLKKSPLERIGLTQVLKHPFMIRYMYPTAAGSAAAVNCINQSTTSSDSGIVTFSSSSSSSSRPHVISMNGYSHKPSENRNDNQLNNNNFNVPVIQTHFSECDSMDLDWQKPSQMHSVKKEKNYVLGTSNRNENQENKYFKALGTNIDIETTPFMIPGIPTTGTAKENNCIIKTQKVVDECISVPPLNTTRLLATRYKTKNAIMSILDNGEVVIEFIKYKNKFNENRITDICRISCDGNRIIIYQPDPGRGLPIREQPLNTSDIGDSFTYSYESLPTRHWKKYVKQAKCHLMESMQDFEISFYSGAKVTQSSSEDLKVFDQNGKQLFDFKNLEANQLLEHYRECLEHCKTVCNALEILNSGSNSCFPVIIGRRPSNEIKKEYIATNSTNSNIKFAFSTPKSEQGSFNFTVSTISSTRNEHSYGNTQLTHEEIRAASQNIPIKCVNIPGIGIATELSHGVIQVQFNDGSLISIIPREHGGGFTHTQSNGISTHFGIHDELPFLVREKLSALPLIELQLKDAPLLSRRLNDNYQYSALKPKVIAPQPLSNSPMKFFR